MATESTLSIISGNDVLITYTITDQDDTGARDLTGATDIIFAIAQEQGDAAVLQVDLAAGVALDADPTTGVFTVTLTKAQTEVLGTEHKYHECRVTDATAATATVSYGTLTVTKNTIDD